MTRPGLAKGASEAEAKFLSKYKNECVIRESYPLQRYQYLQFRSGAFVNAETRVSIERFYQTHLEETQEIIDSLKKEE